MRAKWESLRRDLRGSIDTLKARQDFEKARAERADLQRFADAVSVLDFLNSKAGDLDEKDRILAALIEMVQSGACGGSDLATSLLWLGLWPALDAIYRRRLYAFISRPEELVSEIGIIFTTTIRNADLSHINRVAATLVRNVERDVKEGRRRAWADEARFVELPVDDKLDDDDEEGEEPKKKRGGRGARSLSDLGLVPGLTTDQEVAAIREILTSIVGDDADLVIGALIYEESQREVGDRLGLTHEAARKRFQRAMEKIRSHFKGNF